MVMTERWAFNSPARIFLDLIEAVASVDCAASTDSSA